jgi:hypothetical protein
MSFSVLNRNVRQHRDTEGLARGAREIREVLQRLGLQHAQLGETGDRDRDLADRVAVGSRGSDRLGADHAGGAGLVLDGDRLLEQLGRHLADRAHRA